MSKVKNVLKSTFRLTRNEGNDKVMSLEEAIRNNVEPGMKLHIREGASAASREVLRQFWSKTPEFTLIMSVLGNYGLGMIHAGLVRKLVTAICAGGSPDVRPTRVIQRAYIEGKMPIENWSLYSLVQRLMAGAFGVSFMPTKSIIGSSMAEENRDSFLVTEDPFGSGKKLGLVKSLNPDIALVHGLVADCHGNTIIAPARASGEGAWGAKASVRGAVVTVERLVSTNFIRRYSHLVSIPGYMVNSVSVCPLGAHPAALVNPGLKNREVEAYGEDYQFLNGERIASQTQESLDDWIKEWVLDCPTQDDYLEKLGKQRITYIKRRASRDSWKLLLEPPSATPLAIEEINPKEMMVLVAAQKIGEIVSQHGYKTILAGAGTAGLAAWLAYYQLRAKNYDTGLLLGSGFWGYAPRPGDPTIMSIPTAATCKMISDVVDAYGVFIGSEHSRCLAVLGGGEIDKYGNINSTKIPGTVYLTGAGGANDAVNATEVVVVMAQSRERFVEKVNYVSCPGDRVKTLVSNLGIFQKLGGDKDFTLTGCLPEPKISTLDDRIREIKENCGWYIKVAPSVEDITAPISEQLAVLRAFNPRGET